MKKSLIWLVIILALGGNAMALTTSAPVTSNTQDGSGNAITSTGNALDVNLKSGSLGAGSAVIGKVSIDQTTPGTTNLVQVGGSLPSGSNSIGTVKAQLQDNAGTAITVGQKAMSSSVPVVIASDQGALTVNSAASFSTRADTFTTTSNGTTVDAHLTPYKSFSLAVKATGAVTSWTVILECSLDNANFTTVLTHSNTSPGDGQVMFSGTNLMPCLYFRSRASALTLGGGTNVIATILGM